MVIEDIVLQQGEMIEMVEFHPNREPLPPIILPPPELIQLDLPVPDDLFDILEDVGYQVAYSLF